MYGVPMSQPPASRDNAPWWKNPNIMVPSIVGPLVVAFVLAIANGFFDSDDDTRAPSPTTDVSDAVPPPPPVTPTEPRNLRILLAIDASGSMTSYRVSGNNGPRRIEAAVTGASAALDQLEEPYELGLWTFRDRGPRQEVAIAPATLQHLRGIERKFRALLRRPPDTASTPLYNTISQAIDELQSAAAADVDDTVNALVILTDSNDNPPKDLSDAVTQEELETLLVGVEEEIEVLITAAFVTPCGDLERDVPAFEGNCYTVAGSKGVRPTLRRILRRLEDLR